MENWFRRAIVSLGCALIAATGSSAQPVKTVVTPTVLHTFTQPPSLPDTVRFITPTGSDAVIVSSDLGLRQVTSFGESRTILDSPNFSEMPLVPAPFGGFIGAARLWSIPHNQVFWVDPRGNLSQVHVFRDDSVREDPLAVRRGPDGTIYVSTLGIAQTDVFQTDVLMILPDGRVVPNAFTVPGPVLAIGADQSAYGFTYCGDCDGQYVYRRAPDGSISVIATVPGTFEFYHKDDDLVLTGDGTLIAATTVGDFFSYTCRIVRVTPTVATLHEFATRERRASCTSNLRRDDASGALFGTVGPNDPSDNQTSTSLAYRISGAGEVSTLATFTGGEGTVVDVAPMPGNRTWALLQDAGDFAGACNTRNAAAVVEISADGRRRAFASIGSGPDDGIGPTGPLVVDADGTAYGTTTSGGAFNAGVVYRVTANGHFESIYTFSCRGDGGTPTGVVRTGDGALYGTTGRGTGHGGTVFRIGRSGALTTLFVFRRWEDGHFPGPLTVGRDGRLYGTTSAGGRNGYGTMFAIAPTGAFTVIYHFGAGELPAFTELPEGPLVATPDGSLYGVRRRCLWLGCSSGTLYRIDQQGAYSDVLRCVDLPLVDDDAGRIYANTCSGTIVLTPGRQQVPMPNVGGPFLVRGSEGNVYGNLRSEWGLFRLSPTGLLREIRFAAPALALTTSLMNGPGDTMYGISESPTTTLYRFRRPGPLAPTGFRIVR